MRRREFIAGLGSVAAWPAAVRGQQPAVPVVGYLNTGSRAASSSLEVAFRGGLGSMGFVEGRNVAIDYRYTEYENDRLPELAADLVRRHKPGPACCNAHFRFRDGPMLLKKSVADAVHATIESRRSAI